MSAVVSVLRLMEKNLLKHHANINFRDSRGTLLLSICQLEERLDISIKVANNILPIFLKQNQKVQAQNKTNVWTPPLFQ